MIVTRRNVLVGLIAMPAIIRASSLMALPRRRINAEVPILITDGEIFIPPDQWIEFEVDWRPSARQYAHMKITPLCNPPLWGQA